VRILALLIGLSMAASAAAADAASDHEAALESLREQIAALVDEVQDDVARRGRAETALRDAERAAGRSNARLRELESELQEVRATLAELGTRRELISERRDTERAELAREVALAYRTGSEEPLKLILNQEDPAELARMLAYYGYFTAQRAARIQAVIATLEELEQLAIDVAAQEANLLVLREEEQETLEELQASRTERANAVAALEREIRDDNARIERKRREEQDLVALIAHLTSMLADVPPETLADFESLRERLPWPVRGSLLDDFGQPRAGGRMTWTGVHIGADAGTEVRAVAHGRVAYADWLPGLGLLVVLDHGEGYMTLYGNNQALFAQAGDWVQPGVVIATVGDSGGQDSAGLYYEIRKDGRPLNPNHWMSGRLSRQ
jgi:septal ring factor EnvC (AmiA/AmiB activator)